LGGCEELFLERFARMEYRITHQGIDISMFRNNDVRSKQTNCKDFIRFKKVRCE
jgi:hypothetical protein